jgi:hypothetical protein
MSELFSVLDGLVADDVHHLPEPVLLAQTEMLLTARNKLDSAIARHLQALDAREVTVTEAGRSTRSWLIEDASLSAPEAGQRLNVARALPTHPQFAAALSSGEISHEHIRVILGCVRKLPAAVHEIAETELLTAAAAADPTSPARACRELRIRVGADDDAAAAAQRIYDNRWLTMATTFDGMTHLEGMLDPESAATVAAAIAPLLARSGPEDERTTNQSRADALVTLAAMALSAGTLPDHGGDRPQVIVTIPYTELRDGIAAGQFPTATLNGQPLTPSAARRIACDAGIIPAVLGTDSEILDLGRSRRIFGRAQRRAAALRDKGCVFPRCQAPLIRCQLHHVEFWELSGPTDLNNSAYVCHFHHWLVHHRDWQITRTHKAGSKSTAPSGYRSRQSIRSPEVNRRCPSASDSGVNPIAMNEYAMSSAGLRPSSTAAQTARSVAWTASGGDAAIVLASRCAASWRSAYGTTSEARPIW